MVSRWRSTLLIICFFVILDVATAQVVKSVWLLWDVADLERRYRIPNEIYHHDLLPMVDTTGIWGETLYQVQTNSLGFKDASQRTVELNSDKHRILMIGDSFTEGVGLEFDKTFAGIVAKQLANRNIEVLNAGVIGYSPAIYYRKIKYLLETTQLQIDDVVVFLDISDIPDEAYLYKLDSNDRVAERQGFPSWGQGWAGGKQVIELNMFDKLKNILTHNSITIRLLDTIKGVLQSPSVQREQLPHLLGGTRGEWTQDKYLEEFGKPGLKVAQQSMNKLLALLRKHNIPLTVVVYPWPAQIFYGDLNSVQVSFWSDWAVTNQVVLLNLFPPFFQNADREVVLRKYFIPGDVHCNEAGNQLIGENFLKMYKPAT